MSVLKLVFIKLVETTFLLSELLLLISYAHNKVTPDYCLVGESNSKNYRIVKHSVTFSIGELILVHFWCCCLFGRTLQDFIPDSRKL